MKTHIHYSALRLLLFPSSPYLLFRLISPVATDVYPSHNTRPFHNIWQCGSSSTSEYFYLPDKCVSLVLEDSDLLYGTKVGERLLQQFFWKTAGNTATVYRAVGWTRLVIHFVKSQRLGIGCKDNILVLISKFIFHTRFVSWQTSKGHSITPQAN